MGHFFPNGPYIRITAVERVELEKLSDEDARRDGFSSQDSLRRELAGLYAEKLNEGYHAFRVAFEVLPPEVQRQLAAEREARRARAANRPDSNS